MKADSFFSSKWFTVILLAVVAIVYANQVGNVFDRKIDLNGDNVYYYTLARSLSSGQGYLTVTGNDGDVPHMHFPPGYPAFLSVFMSLGIDSIVQVKIINCVLLLLGILLLFLILRQAGCKPLFSAMVCLLVSCHAEILHWATIMMSEQLFLVVNLLIIYLLCRIDLSDIFRRSQWKTWLQILVIGLLAGYSYLTRSMGLSMSLAAAGWLSVIIVKIAIKGIRNREIDRRKTAGYVLTLFVLVLFAFTARTAWNMRNQHISPGFKSHYFGDFMKKEGGQTMATFDDWRQRASNNAKSYVTYYIPDALLEKDVDSDVHNPQAADWAVGILVILFALLGCVSMEGTGLLILLYCLTTFGVLLIWPEQYTGLRYFITLIPLLIAAFCRGLYATMRWSVKRFTGKNMEVLPLLPVLILLIVLIPRYQDAQKPYHDLAKVRSWKNIPSTSIKHYAIASEWIGKNLPEDARVFCRKPELFYMFSGFHRADAFPNYASPEELMNILEIRRIEYIILDAMYAHSYKTVYPTIKKYPDRFHLLQIWDGSKNSNPTMIVQVVR